MFANQIADKGLRVIIYKELLELSKAKPYSLILKKAKEESSLVV